MKQHDAERNCSLIVATSGCSNSIHDEREDGNEHADIMLVLVHCCGVANTAQEFALSVLTNNE